MAEAFIPAAGVTAIIHSAVARECTSEEVTIPYDTALSTSRPILNCQPIAAGIASATVSNNITKIFIDLFTRTQAGTTTFNTNYALDTGVFSTCKEPTPTIPVSNVKRMATSETDINTMASLYSGYTQDFLSATLTGMADSPLSSGTDEQKNQLRSNAATIASGDYSTECLAVLSDVLPQALSENSTVTTTCDGIKAGQESGEPEEELIPIYLFWEIFKPLLTQVMTSRTPEVPGLVRAVAGDVNTQSQFPWWGYALIGLGGVGLLVGLGFGIDAGIKAEKKKEEENLQKQQAPPPQTPPIQVIAG